MIVTGALAFLRILAAAVSHEPPTKLSYHARRLLLFTKALAATDLVIGHNEGLGIDSFARLEQKLLCRRVCPVKLGVVQYFRDIRSSQLGVAVRAVCAQGAGVTRRRLSE
jgi:hypothetical protein